MELVLLTVCLSIPLGGSPPSMMVYPVVEVEVAELPFDWYGAAFPFVILTEPNVGSWVRKHELQHHRQWRDLGLVSYSAAYLLSAGRAFEDYFNSDWYSYNPPTYSPCKGLL